MIAMKNIYCLLALSVCISGCSLFENENGPPSGTLPEASTVNGNKYKYEFTVRFTNSYYGYKLASRWGFYVGNIYNWTDALTDGVMAFESKIYYNTSSNTVTYRAAAISKGGDPDGDVFGESKTLTLK